MGRNRFKPIKTHPRDKCVRTGQIDTDIKAPILTKPCDRFGLSCSYCEQGAPHPSPQESDWSNEDWNNTKAKAREQTYSLMDYNTSKPQTDIDQKTDVKEIAFSKLQVRQSDLKEELLELTDLLIPPPLMKMPEDMVEKNNSNELSEVEETTRRRRKV